VGLQMDRFARRRIGRAFESEPDIGAACVADVDWERKACGAHGVIHRKEGWRVKIANPRF
jgi:hypothetical protein